MKILIVTHHWSGENTHHSNSSGYQRLAYYLSKNNNVTVLTGGKSSKDYFINKNLRVIIKKVPSTNYFFEERLAISFEALKISKDYDIIHALYSDVGLLPALKYPVIITEHILKEIQNSYWMKYKYFLQRAIFPKVKLIIAVSKNIQQALEIKYTLKDKVITIPHGIDTEIFYPRSLTKELINKKIRSLGTHQYLCLSCGFQGNDSQAFTKIAHLFPQILFIVVGRKEKTDLPNVIQPGKITEDKLIEYYSLADFCFKPLKFATANNSIVEAMAMGKVMITNKIDGVTDYLDNSCGYLAPTISDFPKLFKRAMYNKNEVKNKGKKARKKAVEKFSWDVITPKILKAYKQVLVSKI